MLVKFFNVIKRLKSNLQLTLLILIFLAVVFPYFKSFVLHGVSFVKEQIEIQKRSKEIRKENQRIKERKILLTKYQIKNVYLNASINDSVFKYLEAYKDLNDEWKNFDCDNPPTPTPKPKSDSVFFNIDFEQFRPGLNRLFNFKMNCQNLNKYRRIFDEFQNEIPTLNKLIDDTSDATNENIILFVKQIRNELASYKQTVKNSGYLITKEDAVNIVKNYPEVKLFIERMEKVKVKVLIDANKQTGKSGNEYWNVQVAESYPDHNATFNWYVLDINTGEFLCSFSIYNQKGEYIKNNDKYPCD